jgi:drug/metabolite transporter (DMT)-like permease
MIPTWTAYLVSALIFAFGFRFWWQLPRRNTLQRRIIAIASALGAGCTFLIMQMAITIANTSLKSQKSPTADELIMPTVPSGAETVQIHPKKK